MVKQMTGGQATSEGVALAPTVGEHAAQPRAQVAISDRRQDVSGYVSDLTPSEAMAQLGESLSRAVGRMDDVSLNIETTLAGTRFSFRAYKHRG